MSTLTPLLSQIKIIRRVMGLSKRKLHKAPKWLFPKSVYLEYDRALQSMYVNKIIDAVNTYLIPELPAIVTAADRLRPDRTDRMDALSHPQMIEEAINAVNQSLDVTYVSPQNITAKIAFQTQHFNKRQWQKITKAVFGVDVFYDEPWLQAEMQSFAHTNVALIKSIRVKSVSDIERITYQGVQSGRRAEDIAVDIRKQYGVTRNKAKLIARDQVGKFNGQLTRLRQLDAGVRAFRWSTSGDERVRPQHDLLENHIFSWNDPPSIGFPGEPVQCRCIGEPIFRGFERLLNE